MRTVTSCMECQNQDGLPNFLSLGVERVPDDGVIELSCNRGHRTFHIIQHAKYEILSQLAVEAIHDKYYRESVSTFASALERLFEHYIGLVCRNRGLEKGAIDRTWKPLRNASERQLGAFALMYLMDTGSAFDLIDGKHTAFRNKVVHQGLIPSRSEAIAYGQAVGECARPLIELIHTPQYEEAQQNMLLERLRERRARPRAQRLRYSTGAMQTAFSLENFSPRFDLEKILAERADMPELEGTLAVLKLIIDKRA